MEPSGISRRPEGLRSIGLTRSGVLSGSLKTAGNCIRCATRPSDEFCRGGILSGGFGLKPSTTRLFISLKRPVLSDEFCRGGFLSGGFATLNHAVITFAMRPVLRTNFVGVVSYPEVSLRSTPGYCIR